MTGSFIRRLASLLMVLGLIGCGISSNTGSATMRVLSPANGATVTGSKVKVEVAVEGFNLVAANQTVKANEGHLHFFVDVPASSVLVGQAIPLDQTAKYVHAGKEPFTSRELELAPGKHTITVVVANSAHVVVANPPPVTIEVTVQ